MDILVSILAYGILVLFVVAFVKGASTLSRYLDEETDN